MTDFATAQEMFDHLSTYVADERAVLVAVRRHFPTFRLNLSRAKLRRDDPGMNAIHLDALNAKALENGSRSLLHAIHKSHPGAMKALAAQGRTVVYP